MDQLELETLAARGAERILEECLQLTRQDVLALFWDESAVVPVRLLTDAARRLGVELRDRQLSFAEQAAYTSGSELETCDREMLDAARGVLTCLSNSAAFSSYRSALISAGTTSGVRFGHIPGVNLQILASAVTIDYDAVDQRCDDLALALSLGQRACIETYRPDANGHPTAERLEFDLGGLTRSPISSTGRIPLGTWGNIPGGETFIAPIEGTAEGTFVLDGSFKDHVLQPDTALTLYFTHGRLAQVDGPDIIRTAFLELLEPGRQKRDPFFDCLAELGIGVNSGITELTGNALFDEKCLGTVHIALGDSERYGGRQKSVIHEDLVTRRPSLWVDDRQVLDRGTDVFDATQWRERLETAEQSDSVRRTAFSIRRSALRAVFGDDGLLVRREVAAGRVCLYRVGDVATSHLLFQLYELVPPQPATVPFSQLAEDAIERLKLQTEQVRCGLTILLRHGIVELRDDAE